MTYDEAVAARLAAGNGDGSAAPAPTGSDATEQSIAEQQRRQYQEAATHHATQIAGDQRPFFGSGMDYARSALSGLPRGIASFADSLGPRKITKNDEVVTDPATGRISVKIGNSEPANIVTNYANVHIPEAMGYKPESKIGGLLQTGTEMAPGMLFPAGEVGGPLMKIGSRFTRNVAAPALGAEVAGGIAHKYYPQYEGAARFAGSFGANVLAAMPEAGARAAMGKPTGESFVDADKWLQSKGIKPSVGTVYDMPALRNLEGATQSGVDAFGHIGMAKQYTKSVAGEIGINGESKLTVDTPNTKGTITKAREILGQRYDDLANGISIHMSQDAVNKIDSAIDYFNNHNSLKNQTVSPVIKNVRDNIAFLNKAGIPVDAANLKIWRKQLGEVSRTDSSPANAVAANRAIMALDDDLYQAYRNGGNPELADLMRDTNRKWRNLLVAEDAVRNAPNGYYKEAGLISPDDMSASAQRHGLDTDEPVRHEADRASGVGFGKGQEREVRPTSTQMNFRPVDSVLGAMTTAGYALPTLLGSGALSPSELAGAATALAAGSLTSSGARALGRNTFGRMIATPAGQRYARGIAETEMNNPVPSALNSAMSDNRQNRKSGGRVSSHDMAADQLVRAAERAKKGWSAETEPLLNQSDDAVASALEVANRSI